MEAEVPICIFNVICGARRRKKKMTEICFQTPSTIYKMLPYGHLMTTRDKEKQTNKQINEKKQNKIETAPCNPVSPGPSPGTGMQTSECSVSIC